MFFSRFFNCTNGTKSCKASHIKLVLELLGEEKIEDYIEEEQDDDDDDDDMHDNNAENDENMQKDKEAMYERDNDSNDNDDDIDSENMEDEAKENRYGEDDFEDEDEDDGDDDYEQLYNAESGHDQISQYDKRTDDENEIDDENEDDDDVNDEYIEDENEDEESPRKYPANSKKSKNKNKSRASPHDNNNNLVNGNVEESEAGRDTKPDDEEGSARSSSGDVCYFTLQKEKDRGTFDFSFKTSRDLNPPSVNPIK